MPDGFSWSLSQVSMNDELWLGVCLPLWLLHEGSSNRLVFSRNSKTVSFPSSSSSGVVICCLLRIRLSCLTSATSATPRLPLAMTSSNLFTSALYVPRWPVHAHRGGLLTLSQTDVHSTTSPTTCLRRQPTMSMTKKLS